jgi:hypothetical protein
LGAAAAALLAAGMTPLAIAPRAHADLDDLLFQPFIDSIEQAAGVVGPSPLAGVDPGVDESAVPAAASGIGGAAGAAEPLSATAPADNPTDASIPLQMFKTTEPLVDLSVGGGPGISVLLDTGSNGLVIPIQDLGLQNLSFPTGLGIGQYSGGLDYFYLTFQEPVSFGNGIVTQPTDVDAVLFTFPASLQALFTYPHSLQEFLAPDGAVGVLGIGPDAVGPGPSNVLTALPGDLSQGVLIDEAAGTLTFGPNPFSADAPSVNGVANTNLEVAINGGPLQPVHTIIDTGGVYGTIPSSVLGAGPDSGVVPAGTEISVYTGDGQTLLYSYVTNGYGPTVTSGDTFNTGNIPFAQQPVYIGYTDGGAGATTVFGGNGGS